MKSASETNESHVARMKIELTLSYPSETEKRIPPRRPIFVGGTVLSDAPLPEDTVLYGTLSDADGNVIRYVKRAKSESHAILRYHPLFTAYREEEDPRRERLADIGFPEAAISLSDAEQEVSFWPAGNFLPPSFTNATVKGFLSDTAWKLIFVSATDVPHGAVFDDGMHFTDENGAPYTAFPDGAYHIEVALCRPFSGSPKKEDVLAATGTDIHIGAMENEIICRFHPDCHKQNMQAWVKEKNITLVNDWVPGYLPPYLGPWRFHMGFLPMYRAADVALYTAGKVHLFLYAIGRNSTSYETEFSFLQAEGAIGNPDRFASYYYDIGEPKVGVYESRVLTFDGNQNLAIYRMDFVHANARDGEVTFDADTVFSSVVRTTDFTVSASDRFALSGVMRPFQRPDGDFLRRADNTYAEKRKITRVRYIFQSETETKTVERAMGLARFAEGMRYESVFEFYHVFSAADFAAGVYAGTIEIFYDNGEPTPLKTGFTLRVS